MEKMDKRKTHIRGFTLIELLVVIGIIGLLLSIVIPSLKMAKKKAEEIICRSNLKQWGVVFLTYATENNGRFWIEYNSNMNPELQQGQWMPVLSPYYGEIDKIRLCPSASKPHPDPRALGYGATFAHWGDSGDGGALMRGHKLTSSVDKNYGSYGINWWINNVDPPKHVGWRYKPELHWRGPQMANTSTGRIPMISDCTWFGTNPENTFADSSERIGVVTANYWENIGSYSGEIWQNDISRLLINRHNKGINFGFMDGSAGKVYLWDLLTLKWHRKSVPEQITIPWLPQ